MFFFYLFVSIISSAETFPPETITTTFSFLSSKLGILLKIKAASAAHPLNSALIPISNNRLQVSFISSSVTNKISFT